MDESISISQGSGECNGALGEVVGVCLQTRVDSGRLPGKALLSLGSCTVIEQVMRALSPIKANIFLLLVPERDRSVFEPLAERWGFTPCVGPEEDVLARYHLASSRYRVDTIIRATGDNPLVSAILANRLLAKHRKSGADYSHFVGPPLGTGIEVCRAEALARAAKEARRGYQREHVCPYLYDHPELFVVRHERAPEPWCCEARVTLDSIEDYRRLQKIFATLGDRHPPEIDRLIAHLRGEPL